MTSAFLSMILGASAALHVGDRAPDFTLPDTDGKPVTLSKLLEQGPVVVFFFPKAFTPGCTRQTSNFRDKYDEIKKKGAQVVAISVDDVETLRKFKADRQAQYTFLSDSQKKVVPLYSGTMPVVGLANRANFVIDKDGKVVSIVEGSDAIDPTATVGACPGHS
jgi:thioredoxin-dependent peroxiredoxin